MTRAMQDSGIEWIGEFPQEWRTCKLKHIVATKITDGPHTTPQLLDDGIPFVSAESIKGNKVNLDLKRGYISIEDHKLFCEKCKPQRNDIFMVKSGATTGAIGLVETDEEFSIWSPLALIRCREKDFVQKYVFYSMLCDSFRKQVELFWNYGTQQNIGMSVIENLIVAIPERVEQQLIADYLDKKCAEIDTVIASKQKGNELLKEQRQSIIYEAVTKGLDKNAPLRASGIEWIGDIPAGWETSKVKRFYDIVLGKMLQPNQKDDSDELLDYMCSINITWGGINTKTVKQMWFSQKEKDQYKLNNGDLLVVEGGDVGISCLWNDELEECYLQNAVHRVRSKEGYSNRHLYYWLYALKSIGYIDLICNKATIAHFTKDKFGEIPYIVCRLDEQNAIADYLDCMCADIDQLMQANNTTIEKLKEYRQSVIYEAVTGKAEIN